MFKQISKIKIFLWELLEKELVTILAVCLVMLVILFVKASSDTTNLTFSILSPGGTTTTTGSGGGNVSPRIDKVTPEWFVNNTEVTLDIIGNAFDENSEVILGGTKLITRIIKLNSELQSIVPVGFKPGEYNLCVTIPGRTSGCYAKPIVVYDVRTAPPSTGGVEEYAAMLIKQSPNLTIKIREEAILWAEFKNVGTATWYQDGKNPVRLGTDAKRDRRSTFYHSSWIKYNRPVLVNRVVKPGEIGRFEFTIKSPWTAKKYTEYFKPVAEYKAWMKGNSQVKWVITVQKQSFWKTLFQKPVAPTTKPAAPSTGGKIEMPFKPGATLLFNDRIEQIYQKTVQVITGIFSKLRK